MDKKPLNFAVIQLGARMHYAVPEILAEAGMLACLYTDAASETGLTPPFSWIPRRLRPRSIRRLLARQLPAAIPKEKTKSYLWASISDQLFSRFMGPWKKSANLNYRFGVGGHYIASHAIRDEFAGANAIYVHPCSSTDVIREARRRGMFVVLEAISHPLLREVERRECEKFGAKAPAVAREKLNRQNIEIFRKEAGLADLILAASTYVKTGLAEIGIPEDRVRIVPYGISENFFDTTPDPQVGRVLFVGTVGYLKGVHYLAEAARELRAGGFQGEFRVVGPVEPNVRGRPEFQGLDFLGQIPRSEVKEEFLKADVFAFPTLSDGFGIVLAEALAAGLPIVCTPNCADVVEDKVNGFVVPCRNAGLLAARIREITTNRSLRQSMSIEARRRSKQYTLASYRSRLIAAFQG